MKKHLFFLSIVCSLMLTSCFSNDEEIDTATDENLEEISDKLESLKIEQIQEQQSDSGIDFDESFSQALASTTQKVSAINDFYDYCQHEESYSDTYDGETYEGTIKYFDTSGNEITACDLEEYNPFVTHQTSKITGDGYVYNTFSKVWQKQTMSWTNSSFNLKYESNAELTGTLDFDGDIFNIVEGSYFDMLLDIDIDFDSFEGEDDDFPTELTCLYKIEFDTKGETYRFEMSLDENDIIQAETSNQGFEEEYFLYNSSNKKIGIIKYVYNPNSKTEKFEVYDLNGDQV